MNSTIKIRIDLDGYSSEEIIGLCEQGIVTISEVIESGRMNSEFGEALTDYIRSKQDQLGYTRMITNEDLI